MPKFLLGFLAGALAIVLGVFVYVRLGFVDPRADIPINPLEEKIAMPALDASVDRHAPDTENPVDASNVDLIAGMKIYQSDCANCHGDINRPHSVLADSLYPRVPQFVEDSPDMPENQNFYIIQHGVRLTGMPGWQESLSERQIWRVTTFLSHMDKLPSAVSDQWRAEAGATSADSSPAAPADKLRMHMK